MVIFLQNTFRTVLLLLGVSCVVCAAEADHGMQHRISQLEKQVATLRESYALARADADKARKQMSEIRARLEALGGAALGEKEERIIDTAAQLESTREELDALRKASLKLAEAINAFLNVAVTEDAAARQALETALREQEVALGLRLAPQDELSGTPEEAQVLSIDSESGLIVINAGRDARMRVGMPMEISRGDQAIARAIVTDVRKKVSGLLVQEHLNRNLSVSVGDRVSVTTNN